MTLTYFATIILGMIGADLSAEVYTILASGAAAAWPGAVITQGLADRERDKRGPSA